MTMWYVRITMEVAVAIKVRDLSRSTWIRLEKTEGCSKTFKFQLPQPSLIATPYSTCHYHHTPILTFIGFYLLSVSSCETSDMKRGENVDRCSVWLLAVTYS